MGRIISSVWQTIDGVVDASTMDKWFMPFDSSARGAYINDIIHDCEAMLYGRHTYNMLAGYWSQQRNNEFGIADKLNTTKKYLVSTTVEEANWGETVVISKNVRDHVQQIKNQTKGNILIQGSISIVNQLLKEKLIDELKLLVHPYIAGTGEKLFASEQKIELNLIEHKELDKGVLYLKYTI